MTRWWTRKAKRGWRAAPDRELRDILTTNRKARPVTVLATRGNLPGNGPMLHCFYPVTAEAPASWRV